MSEVKPNKSGVRNSLTAESGTTTKTVARALDSERAWNQVQQSIIAGKPVETPRFNPEFNPSKTAAIRKIVAQAVYSHWACKRKASSYEDIYRRCREIIKELSEKGEWEYGFVNDRTIERRVREACEDDKCEDNVAYIARYEYGGVTRFGPSIKRFGPDVEQEILQILQQQAEKER